MKNEKVFELLSDIDDEIIHDYAALPERKIRRTTLSCFLVSAAAVVAVVIIVGAMIVKYNPALAEKLGFIFSGFIGKDDNNVKFEEYPQVTEKLESNVLCDNAEHVRFEVLEQLTDGMYVLMTVRYTALDDEGQKWLDERFAVDGYSGDYGPNLFLTPDKEAGFVDQGGGGFSEIYDYGNENERYFLLRGIVTSPDYIPGQEMLLRYPVDNHTLHSKEIDLRKNCLEFVSYKLVPEKEKNVHADIKELKVSGLSFAIYSDNTDYDIKNEDYIDSVSLYVEGDEKTFGSSPPTVKRVVDEQVSKDSKGRVYAGFFCTHFSEDVSKYPLRMIDGEYKRVKPYDPDENTILHCNEILSFDKNKVLKIKITWSDKSVSVYNTERK